MIRRIRAAANWLSSIPAVYEWIQRLAGQPVLYRRITEHWSSRPDASVLDVGSSGGALTVRLATAATCVDLDLGALLRARSARPGLRLVAADAARLPFRTESFDHILCVAVSHHLSERTFAAAIDEFARVTRTSLLFLDATRTNRWCSRLLWSLDRGSNPRTTEELRGFLSSRFVLEQERAFRVFHQYILWSARPKRG